MQSEFSGDKTEKIIEEMKRRLTASRWAQSCRIAEIACELADRVGYDKNKARLAALVHDVARDFTQEQTDKTVERYGIRLSRNHLQFPEGIHGTVGAEIAKKELGIDDEEILDAIRNHVSGRPCMGILEEILFLADYIERERRLSPELADEVMKQPLDEAVYRVIGIALEYDTKHRKTVDERTLQTFDWMLEKIRNESKTGPVDMTEEDMNSFYRRMDDLIDLCGEHTVTGFPAENLRDLGGYRTADGRLIKKHRIFRSGHLDRFTPEDFKRLMLLGVNYCIDLRSDAEKGKKPDTGNCGMHYVDIPFEATGDFQSYLDVLLEWLNQCGDPAESAWLAARYFDSFDLDDIYLKLLLDPASQKKFRTILEIMLRDDCTGILVFCRSGKDRTGIISNIIMNALGVDSSVILDDYMVSQIPYYGITMNYMNQLRKKNYNLMVQRQVMSVLGVESERPARLNREILARYKDYKHFFDFERLFNAADARKFREKYLEITE